MLKFYSIIALLFVMSSTVICKIPIDNINSNEIFIEYTKMAAYMTRRFLGPKTNTLVIYEQCAIICNKNKNYQKELMDSILVGLNNEFAIQLFFGYYDDKLWDYNIFIVDSYRAFQFLRYSLPTTQQERFFNFFILLTWSANNETERNKTLLEIFELSLSFNVRNVVIMSRGFDGNYISFHTYELFNKDDCRNKVMIREINRYENGTLQNQYLFRNNIQNYHGCWLNVSARHMPPLLSFDGDVNNETHLMESHRLSGIEGDILKNVAKALNFQIRLRFPNESSIIKLYYDSSGCFKDLDQKRAQIAIGSFSSTLSNSEKYSRSIVYHTTPYVFVVRSGLCFGPIKQLLNPLCPSTWIFLLIFFSVSFVFTKLIPTKPILRDLIFGSKNQKPICSMFAIFFGISIPTQLIPKRNFARFLLAAWLFLSMEVRNGYQGKMFDSLRFSKRIPVPQTISQLIEEDYTLLTPGYVDFYPSNKTQIMRNYSKRLDLLQKSSLRLASTALLDSLAHYNFLNYNTSSLRYVEETVRSFPCVMFFQKHSLLRKCIDRTLNVFSDAGVTSHIATKHVRSWFQNMNTRSQFVSKLANENLKGLYFISGIMFMISIFVFILELLTRKSRRLQKIMDVLN